MFELTTIQQISIGLLPILFAITFHEAAHAWVAWYFGDSTAKMLGRLTFNPIKHIDLIGTIVVPLLTLMISQSNFVFGWAKPVPINPSQFTHPRRDLALATLAGPAANLLMALSWAVCFKVCAMAATEPSNIVVFILLAARAGIMINLLLAFLNLIPIPPLDGGRIMTSLLPPQQALLLAKIEPFGFIILITLAMTGALGWLITPPIQLTLALIHSLLNI